MNKVFLLILTLCSFYSHATYNWETGVYTLEGEVIFKVKPFHSPQFINEDIYCNDYASSFTKNPNVRKTFCLSLIENTANTIASTKTSKMVADICESTPKQCKSQRKVRIVLKEMADKKLLKLKEYDAIVITQRQKKHEVELKQKMELAKIEIDKKKKDILNKTAVCKKELEAIIKIDRATLTNYEADVSTLEKAIESNNFRYARSSIQSTKKPNLLITEANGNCFQFLSFQQFESESKDKLNSTTNRLNIAIEKVNNYKESPILTSKKIIPPKKVTKNSPEKIKNLKTVDSYTNTMANYATLLGRSTACGINTTKQLERVGSWMDNWFKSMEISPKMQASYLSIFIQGYQYHIDQQLDGKTPDTCSSVTAAFYKSAWP